MNKEGTGMSRELLIKSAAMIRELMSDCNGEALALYDEIKAELDNPEQKPLSDDDIDKGFGDSDQLSFMSFQAGVRFTEEKHGIKEQE